MRKDTSVGNVKAVDMADSSIKLRPTRELGR